MSAQEQRITLCKSKGKLFKALWADILHLHVILRESFLIVPCSLHSVILCSWADILHLHVILREWIAFYSALFPCFYIVLFSAQQTYCTCMWREWIHLFPCFYIVLFSALEQTYTCMDSLWKLFIVPCSLHIVLFSALEQTYHMCKCSMSATSDSLLLRE